jgi:hypothetical protein
MAISVDDYLEKIDSVSPSNAGFAVQGGKATIPYYVQGPQPQDLIDAITTVLGNLDTSVGIGQLTRTLPQAHPIYGWMYSNAIEYVRGVGAPVKTDALSGPLLVSGFPDFALYPWYELGVSFTPRPYAVLPDNQVTTVLNSTWYDQDGVQIPYRFATEWLRYTVLQWFPVPPAEASVTAVQGTMNFVTSDGSPPGAVAPALGNAFAGMPRVFMPNTILKVTWYQVPYRYVTSPNSFFRQYLGRVNQKQWLNFYPGEMLYLNYTPIIYQPPNPDQVGWFAGIFSQEKWCDVELTFLVTTREGRKLPQGVNIPGHPELSDINPNWVIDGHNLQPWLGAPGDFFYATVSNVAGQTAGRPLWLSGPIPEILFTDPDAQPSIQNVLGT